LSTFTAETHSLKVGGFGVFSIGLEFTLLNVMPPEGQSPIDNRFLSLFVQSRFGK